MFLIQTETYKPEILLQILTIFSFYQYKGFNFKGKRRGFINIYPINLGGWTEYCDGFQDIEWFQDTVYSNIKP